MHNTTDIISFDLDNIDNKLLEFCHRKFTKNDNIIINIKNNIKIEFISMNYNIKIFEQDYNKIKY